jgi:hypothetical protein
MFSKQQVIGAWLTKYCENLNTSSVAPPIANANLKRLFHFAVRCKLDRNNQSKM